MGIGSTILRALVGEVTKEVRAAYRENERLEARKERLKQLGKVHVLVIQDFIKPLGADIAKLSQKDAARINRCLVAMNERGETLFQENTPALLSRYATAIKSAAIIAMNLCKK